MTKRIIRIGFLKLFHLIVRFVNVKCIPYRKIIKDILGIIQFLILYPLAVFLSDLCQLIPCFCCVSLLQNIRMGSRNL